MNLTTYSDLVDHALTYLAKSADEAAALDARRAVQAAYREVANARQWSCYFKLARLNLSAPYSTGTVAYDHTGGTYERQLTLTDGTWPDWAAYGDVKIDDVCYEVADRKSATVLQLAELSNPGEDVAAGEAYTIFRDTYPLPSDLIAVEGIRWADQSGGPCFAHASHWLDGRARVSVGQGRPSLFAVTGDPNFQGLLAARFDPAPDAAYAAELLYQRRGRPLKVFKVGADGDGTVSVTAGSQTVTGVGTSFSSAHAGAVIRFSEDENEPDDLAGVNPAAEERVVMSVTNSTTLLVDDVATQTLSGVAYLISDPVDVEAGAMMNYLLREVERQVRLVARMKATNEELMAYEQSRLLAFEADSRFIGPRVAGAPLWREALLRETGPLSL